MEKTYFIVIPLFMFQLCYSQENVIKNDTIRLNEIVITKGNNKKEVAKIIEKIKYNLRKNYETGYINYVTKHFSLRNKIDTLIDRKMLNRLQIKELSYRNISHLLNKDSTNPFHRDTSPFSSFEPIDSENHYFALSIFYDSLKVIDFDFFDMNKHYKYRISTTDNITTIKFTASRYYSGYFSFDNINYNLIRIAFKNTNPYGYYVNGYSRIIDSYLEFSSDWTFNKVTVLLDFRETDKGKVLLERLDAMQEIIKFKSIRYDYPNRILARDFNSKFHTTLSMRILE